jgi:hypothetical protein
VPKIQNPKSKIKKLRKNDIKWSNPYGDQITHFVDCIESFNIKNFYCNHEKTGITFDTGLTIYVSSTNEKKNT